MNSHTLRDAASPAAELVQSANQLEVAYAPYLYKGLSLADLAHVVMLAQAGIIPPEPARELISVLLEIHAIPASDFYFDPAVGDAYKNREREVLRRAPNAGGWLRTGRARREATNVAFQIAVRERLLAEVDALVDLAEALMDQAGQHIGTLMPDLTYLQHAQPTTFAHYLLAFVYAIQRDIDRISACFGRVNQCSGGIGSVNGSRLPFDRSRLAKLLGCSAAITHARDAMWQADMPVEIMACVTAAVLNFDRLGEDLQIWVTQEFDLADLADAYCRESVIMPQKKNPYSLSYIRGAAGVLIGQMTAMANVGRTPTGQPDNRIFAYGDIPRALDLAAQATRLMAGVVRTLTVNRENMAAQAALGYSQATDLAECIMLETGLPYLSAHRLVSRLVSTAAAQGIPAAAITPAMVSTAALEVAGATVDIPADVLSAALDPREIVATRTGLGGAAPQSVQAMLAETHAAAGQAREWRRQTSQALATAEQYLLHTAGEIAAGIPGGYPHNFDSIVVGNEE
jgi:argininosuccinate lyase